MKEGAQVLQVGVTVFKVLAWLSLVVQAALGIILLIAGGVPVPVGGVEVPARLVGVLNIVAAAIYFFMLFLIASVLRLLLDLRNQTGRTG